MGDLLRNQLLKAGLASKKQAKAAAHAQRLEQAQARKEKHPAETLAAEERQRQRREQAERDRERNRKREEERQEKERLSQARDLVRQHALPLPEKGVTYHFSHGKAVKAITVSKETQDLLSTGQAGIVFLEGAYLVLPKAAARKVEERLPEALLVLFDPPVRREDASPYEEYPVPDDLMW